MEPFLESELFRTLGAAAIGGFAGGLLVLLGTYWMRRWELATQYRISNIAETYIALSREIGTVRLLPNASSFSSLSDCSSSLTVRVTVFLLLEKFSQDKRVYQLVSPSSPDRYFDLTRGGLVVSPNPTGVV